MESRSLERLGPSSLAALLSLALHGLILAPLVAGPSWGRSGSVAEKAQRRVSAPSDPTSVFVLLEDSGSRTRDAIEPPPEIDPSAALTAREHIAEDASNRIELPQIDLQDVAEERVEPALAQADGNGVPAYVTYMGQVTARIQRLWALPQAARAAEFHCHVRIRRGPGGEVRDLILAPCDTDPVLKASVLAAIRRAAPLPERPNPQSSAEMLSLDFAVFAAAVQGRSSSVQPAPLNATFDSMTP